MKLTKKILATVLVLALTIAAVPVMGATVDATNTVPNKKSLMKLVDEFSTPIGVTEEYIMKPGKSITYNFSKVTARADMLRFKAEKKNRKGRAFASSQVPKDGGEHACEGDGNDDGENHADREDKPVCAAEIDEAFLLRPAAGEHDAEDGADQRDA